MKDFIYTIDGCLPAKVDIRDYKLCSDVIPQIYPEKFELTNLPRVKTQGIVNSCCAHAMSSILEYFDKNQHGLSTNFIYGIQHKLFNQTERGMYLVQACKIVQDYGDPYELDCSGNQEIPIVWKVAEDAFSNESIMQKAYYYRILSYYQCTTDSDIKYALMNYGPVLAAVNWRSGFTLDSDSVVTFDKNSRSGGHAIMIYGWNEKGWLIQNSWGESFGNHGRCIIPYTYGLMEARAIIDFDNGEDPVLMKPELTWFQKKFYKIINWVLTHKRKS